MNSTSTLDVDFVEELKLRRWALENYVPAAQRDDSWHPVVLHEMDRLDSEALQPVCQA